MLHAELAARRSSTSRTPEWALLAIVAVSLVFAHRSAIVAMVGLWSRSPMYSYAFTVPFIAGYLLWVRRGAFRELEPQGSWLLAIPVLMTGTAMSLAARVGSVQLLDQVALLVDLVGAVIAIVGWRYVRVGWAGLAYLLLMVPIWDGFTESLHRPFQNQSAAIGMFLLRLIGIPTYRDGIFIALPNLNIEVARACSGVNYLVAVVALGLPAAYVYLSSPIRQLLLIVGAVVIAALSNGLRVALIGTLAHYEIGSPLHGPFHVLHGLFVAGIGYVALFVGLRWLSTPEQRRDFANTSAVRTHKMVPVARVVAVAAILVVIGGLPTTRLTPAVPLAAELEMLPEQLGGWSAWSGSRPKSEGAPGDAVRSWIGADRELTRRYANAGHVISLYVGYFERQSQNRELAGSGAAALHRAARVVQVPTPSGLSFAANVVDVGGAEPAVEVFWYEIDGRSEVNRYRTAATTAWNALSRGRNNGAVVMLSERIAGEADRPRSRDALIDLAGHLRQALLRLLSTPFSSIARTE
jgi:EpsI family protein